jgi:chemotaxis protein MotB
MPRPVTEELARIFARTFVLVENGVAVDGHTRSRPVVLAENPVWDLSIARAAAFRGLLEEGGLAPPRMVRVTGHADRDLATRNALDVRNNRIEVVLLRSDAVGPR